MAVAVEEIITAARNTHEAFAPDPHPDSVCVTFLSRYHRMLMSKVVRYAPHRFALVQNIVKATWEGAWDKGDTGVAVQDHHVYLPGRANHVDTESWDILSITEWETRPREFRQVNDAKWPAYSIVAGTIHFQGDMVDWSRYSDVDIYYVPMTADLTAIGNITLPDSAEQALVAGLVYHLCNRSANANNPSAPDCRLFRQDWVDSERAFLDEVAGQQAHHASVTLDVW
jgi:hypothetical protein